METKTTINERTKDEKTNSLGVVLSLKDAEEYRTYIRRKKQTEITDAIADSAGTMMQGEDVQRVCERAVRLKQASVKLPLTKLSQAFYYLNGSGVKLDCLIGGDGETVSKVKAYEAKLAQKRGATEITLTITPSLIDCCRYGEIRREIKRVKRSLGKATLKVRVQRAGSLTALGRIARIASETGAKSSPFIIRLAPSRSLLSTADAIPEFSLMLKTKISVSKRSSPIFTATSISGVNATERPSASVREALYAP